MRRTALFGMLVAAFVVGGMMVKGVSAGEEASGPEFIKLEKVGKQLPVNFPHKLHGEKAKCADCHGGDKPLFAQKVSGKGELMKDMYAGKSCGACHDGKKAFKAMGGCAKCHKKAEAAPKADAAPEAKKEEAAPAAAAGAAGPEFIKLEKVGKQAVVNFPHKMHGEKAKCDDCHGGDKPLFAQKVSGKGELMKDMYAGKSCGACHDGKKAFKAMGGCAKCHKK